MLSIISDIVAFFQEYRYYDYELEPFWKLLKASIGQQKLVVWKLSLAYTHFFSIVHMLVWCTMYDFQDSTEFLQQIFCCICVPCISSVLCNWGLFLIQEGHHIGFGNKMSIESWKSQIVQQSLRVKPSNLIACQRSITTDMHSNFVVCLSFVASVHPAC